MLQSDRSFFRYLPASPAAREWGIYVVNAGHALVPPGSPYPPCRHPEDHQCVADRGRVLPTYHLLYVAAGQGEFESKLTGACRLGAGDLVILRPGMWHRYRPVLEVGWHEYWFEFDGDLAGRWMNRKEFLKAGPILHMGPVQPFLERMLDLLRQERPGSDLILGAFAAEAIAEILRKLHWRLRARAVLPHFASRISSPTTGMPSFHAFTATYSCSATSRGSQTPSYRA